jgi:uncharacterized damage-inducible protein DinB
MSDQDPRYPIGRYRPESDPAPAQRAEWIGAVEALPRQLRAAVAGLSPEQLDTPYRDGGWSVRQVVHHLPDSHLNAYIRFKLALTEESPTIKPYDEAAWAALPDSRVTPPEVSLTMLEALHQRWLDLVRAMSDAEFARTFVHPERPGAMRLDSLLGLYAWHGRHHLAHITGLRERMGWG